MTSSSSSSHWPISSLRTEAVTINQEQMADIQREQLQQELDNMSIALDWTDKYELYTAIDAAQRTLRKLSGISHSEAKNEALKATMMRIAHAKFDMYEFKDSHLITEKIEEAKSVLHKIATRTAAQLNVLLLEVALQACSTWLQGDLKLTALASAQAAKIIAGMTAQKPKPKPKPVVPTRGFFETQAIAIIAEMRAQRPEPIVPSKDRLANITETSRACTSSSTAKATRKRKAVPAPLDLHTGIERLFAPRIYAVRASSSYNPPHTTATSPLREDVWCQLANEESASSLDHFSEEPAKTPLTDRCGVADDAELAASGHFSYMQKLANATDEYSQMVPRSADVTSDLSACFSSPLGGVSIVSPVMSDSVADPPSPFSDAEFVETALKRWGLPSSCDSWVRHAHKHEATPLDPVTRLSTRLDAHRCLHEL